jgi:ketosteroid isomerase-like protein
MKRIATVLLTLGIALTFMTDTAHMEDTTSEAEAAAKNLIDEFFEAFNAEDNDALQKIANYPHSFLLDNGRVITAQSANELVMNFDAMKEREGWHHSTLDAYKVCQSSAEKVHVELTFSRHKADGTNYWTVPALWIVTKQDGKWGIQIRSLMPATQGSRT